MMFPKVDPSLQFYLIIAVFIVLAVVGLPVAVRVWNDTRHGVVEETDSPEELLTPLEAAYRSGQMTEEEYLRIQQSVERVVTPTWNPDPSEIGDAKPAHSKSSKSGDSAKSNDEPGIHESSRSSPE